MSTIADLLIKLGVDSTVDKDLKGVGGKVKSGVNKAFLPAIGALTGIGVAAKIGFGELADAQKVTAQTEAVLKSTGGAAHVTAAHIDELSNSLLNKSGVDDEAIKSGANLLLTFTNIRNEAGKGNDIFDQATTTMLDMSTALGTDMKSSATLLGKALNDPVKGLTALQRVGVAFTEDQKKQIGVLVKNGNAMGAQKIILGELSKEFGGSAAAAGQTFAGKMSLAKEQALNFAAELVSGALPTLEKLAEGLSLATGFLEKHQTMTKLLIGAVAALAAGILIANVAIKTWTALQAVARVATVAWTAAQWLLNAALSANPIGIVIIAIAALGLALVALWTKSETFRKIVTAAWTAIKNTTVTVWNFIRDHIKTIMAILLVIMTGGIGALVLLIVAKWGAIKAATTAAWDAIRGAVSTAVNAVKAVVTGGFNAVASAVSGAVGRVRSIVSAVFGALAGIVKAAIGPLQAGVAGIVGAFNGVLSILHTIESVAGSAASAIDRVVSAAGKVGGVAGKVAGLAGHIPGFASGVSNFAGGLAVVGEQGPELVNLPRGTDVLSNRESAKRLGGPGVSIQGDLVVREELDIERIGAMITRRLSVVS